MSHHLVTQRTREAQRLLSQASAIRAEDGAEAIQLCHQAASQAMGAAEAEAGLVARTRGGTLLSRWQSLEVQGHAPRTVLAMRSILGKIDEIADRTHPHTPGAREPQSGDVAGISALTSRMVEVFRAAAQVEAAPLEAQVEVAPKW